MRGLTTAIAALALAAPAAGCGDDEEETSTTILPAPAEEPQPADDEDASGRDSGEGQEPQEPTSEAAQVVRVVRSYVRALDDRNGERVCDLLAPGAIDAVDLRRDRGTCAASMAASIGYRDPRGLPVWRAARVGEIVSTEVDGDNAKVVATTITLFADREEPSIEDDVVYLVRQDDTWLIAKPSLTLYRAVGIADVPPSVLAPP